MKTNQIYKGINTSREYCYIQHSENIIDLPLNSRITRFDINSKNCIYSQQLHTSIITILLTYNKKNNIFISFSYEGEIKFWKCHINEKKNVLQIMKKKLILKIKIII